MGIKQLSVFVENSKGKLADCLKILGDSGVDIRAMSIADTRDFGILRIIVSDSEKAVNSLKQAEFIVSVNEVIGIAVGDEPGALAKVALTLSERDVNIEYVYAFITASKESAYVVIRVEDNEKCIEVLKENNVKILCEEDILAM